MERAQPSGTELDLERSSKRGQELPATSEEPNCPSSASGVMGSVRSHRTPGGVSGWEQHCSVLFQKPPPVAHPPQHREGRTGVLRCSQGDQVTARSNASFKGTSRLEAEVQLDCRVFPSGPDAATGASGAPKTARTSSERGAKTKTSQDSCHFRRLEGCRRHATH